MEIKTVHRYLGLCLSLLVLVISITGVLLVWKREYLILTVPHADQAVNRSNQAIADTIGKILSDQPVANVRLIQVHHERTALYKAILKDKQAAWYDQSGQKIQQWSANDRIEDWLLDLHHRFLLGNTLGLNMAGFSGILLVPLVFFGMSIWWRRRRIFKLGIWPKSFNRGQLLISHGNLGAISVIPILVIAITGVILVYPVESAKVLLPNDLGEAHQQVLRSSNSFSKGVEKLDFVLEQYPEATIRWFRPPSSDYPETIIGLQQKTGLNRLGNTTVSFYGDGRIQVFDATTQLASKRLFDFMFPMHTGKLPLWYRLLLTVFGMALTIISAFGLRSYWLSRGENGNDKKRLSFDNTNI